MGLLCPGVWKLLRERDWLSYERTEAGTGAAGECSEVWVPSQARFPLPGE